MHADTHTYIHTYICMIYDIYISTISDLKKKRCKASLASKLSEMLWRKVDVWSWIDATAPESKDEPPDRDSGGTSLFFPIQKWSHMGKKSWVKDHRLSIRSFRLHLISSDLKVWLELAKDYEVGAATGLQQKSHVAPSAPRSKACIWLDIPEATCGERVLQRFGHRTLPPEDKSLEASSLRMMRFCFCMFNLMKHVNLHCVASISLPSIWIRKFFEPGHQWLCTTLWASDGGAVGGSGGETNQVNRTIQLLIRKLYYAILIHSSTNNHTQICTHNTHIHELISIFISTFYT